LIWFLRIVGGAFAAFGAFMIFGIAVGGGLKTSGDVFGGTFCLGLAVLGVYMIYRAQLRIARNESVVLNAKLIELGQATGTLTVAQVVAKLSITADEANEALKGLTRDGIAQFDVDDTGAPIYRVQKVK
jgi:hypothetical protein